jgi:hypothetical protein
VIESDNRGDTKKRCGTVNIMPKIMGEQADRGSIPGGSTDVSLLHVVQTGSEVHPASYLKGTGGGGDYPGRDADHFPSRAWSTPPPLHTSLWCHA